MQEVLARHDILFIADEVITGFGRTGSMFATKEFDLNPDMITLAKGLSSAYHPISAVMVGKRVTDAVVKGSTDIGWFGHGFTYWGIPYLRRSHGRTSRSCSTTTSPVTCAKPPRH